MRRLTLLAVASLPAALAAHAQGLSVVGRTPARNAVAAPRPDAISLTFSSALAAGTAGNVRVFSAQRGGQLVRGGNATASGSTLTVVPAQALRPGETISVSVPATVSGANGSAASRQVYRFTAAATGGGGGFVSKPDVAGNQAARHLRVGDLNGDGSLDVATVNWYTGQITLNLNTGSGTFTAAAGPSAGEYAFLDVADVDGDGDLDLLTINQRVPAGVQPVLRVYLNDGRAAFGAATTVPCPTSYHDLTTADVDGDGDLDVLAVWDMGVSVFSNSGSGAFGSPVATPMPYYISQAVPADVDSDGDLDLLVTRSGAYRVSTYFNNGSGTFGTPTDVPITDVANTLAVADVDGDGDLDVLSTGGNSNVNNLSVRLNDGSGTFGGGSDLLMAGYPTGLTVADLDGDGDLDVATANNTGSTLSVRLNNGQGVFGGTLDLPVGQYQSQIAAGDLDNDGDLDLLTGGNSLLNVRLNQAAGPLATRAPGRPALPLYPVPARSYLTVEVPGTGTPCRAQATLCNSLGQEVRRQATDLPATGGPWQLPVAGLPPGLYLLRLQAGAATYAQPVAIE